LFQVRAIDAVACGAPLSFDLRVDATPDSIQLLIGLKTPSGASITSGVFQNDPDPQFVWAVAPSAAPLAGSSFAVDGSADCTADTGTTSQQIAPVPDGSHSFQVRAIDTAGNCGPASTFDLRVDATLDPVATLRGFVNAGGAEFLPGAWEPDSTPFMQWSSTPGAAPTAGYSSAADGAADCTSEGAGTTYQFGVIGNGSHSFQVRAIDDAGNCGPVATFNFGVDLNADGIGPITLRTSPGGAVIGAYTNDPDPYAEWIVGTSGPSPTAGVSHALDVVADCAQDTLATSLQLPSLAEGSRVLHLRAIDAAGNCGNDTTKCSRSTSRRTRSLRSPR